VLPLDFRVVRFGYRLFPAFFGAADWTDDRSESARRASEASPSTTDTRIFSRVTERLRSYISESYRDVRCPICITVRDGAQLIHANFTHVNHCLH
jgi:hypothetical protein